MTLKQSSYIRREYSAHERANLLSTGMNRAKIDMAKKLLDKGMDIDTILEITELPIEQIIKLQEEIDKISDFFLTQRDTERFQLQEFPCVYKHWKLLMQKKYEIW